MEHSDFFSFPSENKPTSVWLYSHTSLVDANRTRTSASSQTAVWSEIKPPLQKLLMAMKLNTFGALLILDEVCFACDS